MLNRLVSLAYIVKPRREHKYALQRLHYVAAQKTCLVIEQAVAEGHYAAATRLQHPVDLRKYLLWLHTGMCASAHRLQHMSRQYGV